MSSYGNRHRHRNPHCANTRPSCGPSTYRRDRAHRAAHGGLVQTGLSPEKIAERIGHLSLAPVHAALAYYHANRAEIEADIAAAEAEADRLEREHSVWRGRS